MEMTTLTHQDSLFLGCPTSVQAHQRGIERKSTDGVEHIRVIVSSLDGILFGFDTALIVRHHECAVRKVLPLCDRSRSHRGLERTMRHVARAPPPRCSESLSSWWAAPRAHGYCPLLIVFIASFAIARGAVIWLLFPMSDARDVALERTHNLLRARRHGAAHCNMGIQLPWGGGLCD
jgi:hypothetical protein